MELKNVMLLSLLSCFTMLESLYLLSQSGLKSYRRKFAQSFRLLDTMFLFPPTRNISDDNYLDMQRFSRLRLSSLSSEGRGVGIYTQMSIFALATSTVFGASISRTMAAQYSAQSSQSSPSTLVDSDTSVASGVIKRSSDERDYLPVTLSNGMRVLLISDPATVRAAAALDVHVGSFSDPDDLQGLAHFTGMVPCIDSINCSHSFINRAHELSWNQKVSKGRRFLEFFIFSWRHIQCCKFVIPPVICVLLPQLL